MPVTYKTWSGLFSITIDSNGFGSYTIGEGLNGGYTVEEFPDGQKNFLIKLIPGLYATITSPKNGDVFMVGETFQWVVEYRNQSGISSSYWTEKIDLEGNFPGPVTIRSGYGTVLTPIS